MSFTQLARHRLIMQETRLRCLCVLIASCIRRTFHWGCLRIGTLYIGKLCCIYLLNKGKAWLGIRRGRALPKHEPMPSFASVLPDEVSLAAACFVIPSNRVLSTAASFTILKLTHPVYRILLHANSSTKALALVASLTRDSIVLLVYSRACCDINMQLGQMSNIINIICNT